MATWHDKHLAQSSPLDKLADVIAGFAGSCLFVLIHIVWFTLWILFVEKYPFGLLTLCVSLESIFLSTFVMMNQNRGGDRDRVQALEDYKTNREAKEEIELIQIPLARMEEEHLGNVNKKLDKLLKKKS